MIGIAALGGIIAIYILFIVGAIVLNYFIARMIAKTVELKGYTLEETHAFAKCFWLGVAGWVYVLALPDKKLQINTVQIYKKISDINIKLDETKKQ